MNILMCDIPNGPLTTLANSLHTASNLRVIDVVHTGRDISQAIHNEDIHISLISPELLDLVLLLEKTRAFHPNTKKALAVTNSAPPLIIKAHHFGLHDVVNVMDGEEIVHQHLQNVVNGHSSLDSHPVIQALRNKNGQLNKSLTYSDVHDTSILQLLALGMTDDEIATTVELDIQQVRNRISQLIHDNDLANRTQLAVLQAINVLIPDFA